jgi:plastocyanin
VLTVEPGAIVEWINIGDDFHTAASITPTARIEGISLLDLSSTDGWDSGLLGSGETYKRRLNAVGSYYYYDHENPAYIGLIVVEEKEGHQIYLPLVLRNG